MDNFEIVNHSEIENINLFLVKVMYRTVHLHRDLEILFVVSGSMAVVTLEKEYSVKANQFFFLNSNQSHEIRTDENGVTLICLQISPNYFKRFFPSGEMFYFDDCTALNRIEDSPFEKIRSLFLEMAKTYMEQRAFFKIQFDSQLNRFFYEILSENKHHMLSQEEISYNNSQLSRLNKLLEYVDQNYTRKIRLQDFAEKENLSLFFLSHYAKHTLHQTFRDYVTSLRVHHACILLLNSDKKIIDICLESGFSDTRYLYKAFKTAYNMSPYEYREEYRSHPDPAILTQISEHSLQQYFPRKNEIRIVNEIMERKGDFSAKG